MHMIKKTADRDSEIEQRHRLAAERVDHRPTVDDLLVLAAGLCRPRGGVISGVDLRRLIGEAFAQRHAVCSVGRG
ncbi:MAG: hypothetical protein IPK66_07470 [Rhodospirillales bacterium]|nr:hypothetical protein [Rhodospirillales bacterium]